MNSWKLLSRSKDEGNGHDGKAFEKSDVELSLNKSTDAMAMDTSDLVITLATNSNDMVAVCDGIESDHDKSDPPAKVLRLDTSGN